MFYPTDPSSYYGSHRRALEQLLDVLHRVSQLLPPKGASTYMAAPSEFNELARVVAALLVHAESSNNVVPQAIYAQNVYDDITKLGTRVAALEMERMELKAALKEKTDFIENWDKNGGSREYKAFRKMMHWLQGEPFDSKSSFTFRNPSDRK